MSPKELLRSRQDEARVGRMWRAIEARRHGSPRRRAPMLIGALSVVAVLALLAFGLWPAPPTGALTLADAKAVPTSVGSERELRFADGSRIASGDRTRLDLLENTAGELAFALRQGRARFEVEPGGPRRWRVAAGEVEVVVVGTVFEVERTGGRVSVSVTRGAVRVRGPGVRDGEQRLEAGERLVVEPPRVEPMDAPEEAPERVVEPVEQPAPQLRPAPPVEPLPSPTELLGDADAARARGDVRAAVHLLERVWREHPRDSRAPLAAFTQGRLELDRLHDPAGAAATLGRAIDLGLQAPLRETAEALRVDAWGRIGDARAARAARRFLEAHPSSDYRDDVSRWLPAEEDTPRPPTEDSP